MALLPNGVDRHRQPGRGHAGVAGKVGLLWRSAYGCRLVRVVLVIDQLPRPSAIALPSTVVPLVSYSVTVAPASAPLPLNTGVVTLVMLSVLEAPVSVAAVRSGADGATAAVSIVTASPAEATLVLPARSVCLAVSV